MLNGYAHHSLEAEVELRIWPLPDFQTRARGMIADAALVLHLSRSPSGIGSGAGDGWNTDETDATDNYGLNQ